MSNAANGAFGNALAPTNATIALPARPQSNALARFCSSALPYSVFLYALATLTSMAGMEIFGTLAQLLALLYLVSDPARALGRFSRFASKSDIFTLALFATVIVGSIATPPRGVPWIDVIGSARWMVLFFFTRSAVGLAWPSRWHIGLLALMGVAGLIGALGIFQYFTGIDILNGMARSIEPSFASPSGRVFYRSEGLLGFTMTFAHSMAMSACFAFAFALLGVFRRPWQAALVALCALLCTLSVVGSLARGAWLSLGLAFFVMAAFAGGRRFFATLAVLAVVAGSVWAWVPGIGARASTIVDASFPSNTQREALWRANWDIFLENPVVGVGYGMNEIYVPKYLDKLGISGVEGGHAHNNYLQFLSGTGFIGFACYILFSAYFFWISARAWHALPRERAWERAAILAAIGAQVALHAGGLTECNFKDAEVNHQFLMILAMVAAIDRSLRESPPAAARSIRGAAPAHA